MPRIEDIQKFNDSLVRLADEPRIAATRGEQVEQPRAAEENTEAGVGPDSQTRTRGRESEQQDAESAEREGGQEGESPEDSGGQETGAESGEAGASGGEADEGIDDDLRALLGGMDEDEPDEAGGAGEEAEEDPFAGIDFDFDESEGEEPGDEPSEPAAAESAQTPEPGETEPASAEAAQTPEPGGTEPPTDADEETGPDTDTETDEDFDLDAALDDLNLDEPEDRSAAGREARSGDDEGVDVEQGEPAGDAGQAGAGQGEESGDAGEEDFGDIDFGLEEEEGSADAGEEDFGDIDFGLEEEESGDAGEEDFGDIDPGLEEEQATESGETDEDEDIFGADVDEEFSFTDEEPEEVEAAPPAGANEPDEELGTVGESETAEEEDDFDLGDFGDFGEALEGEEESAEEFDFDEEGVDQDDFGDLDDFSLGDFGAEFGVIEEGAENEEDLNPALAVPTERPQSEGTDEGPGIHLNDTKFKHITETLDTLPLNLRIAVEEVLGEGDFTEEEAKPLVEKLAAGAPPKEIARVAGGLKGERIRLPRNYEVRRGVVFEDQKQTFAWQLRHRYLPLARNITIAAALAVAAVWLAVAYVYSPLYARYLYLQGLEEIESDRYTVGNEFFDDARQVWETEHWYYRYADAFIERRQYRLAQEKFDELLERFPFDREGLLRYADFESATLGDYEKAEELYERVIEMDTTDYDGLLGKADNYLRWADVDSDRFEDARELYARLHEFYGQTDEIMQRFMRYFVRTDNFGEVERLVEFFEEVRTDAEVHPRIYSEAAGYMLDYDEIEYVRDMLSRVLEDHPRSPEAHYELARFYDERDERDNLRRALENARSLFPEHEPLSRRRMGMYIDSHTLTAEYYADGEEYLTAEQYYADAIDLYEDALETGLVEPREMFGRMYAGLGDIYYYESAEYEDARRQFETAEENEYSSNTMRYQLGWIAYRNENYGEAIDRFETVENSPTARNIRYALGNTHYYRGNYFAAQTYLQEVVEIIRQERERIGFEFNLEERPEHRRLIEYRIMAHNNLGVAYHRRFEQEEDPDLRGEALYHLTNSTQDATNLARDPETAERTDTTDLAYLNQQYILFPDQPYTLRIYRELPMDLEDQDFFPTQL
ncbi:MAG: periplasmic flagellar collar protein FlcA [Spirochaetales bacterium]